MVSANRQLIGCLPGGRVVGAGLGSTAPPDGQPPEARGLGQGSSHLLPLLLLLLLRHPGLRSGNQRRRRGRRGNHSDRGVMGCSERGGAGRMGAGLRGRTVDAGHVTKGAATTTTTTVPEDGVHGNDGTRKWCEGRKGTTVYGPGGGG